jgi:hypothetical protein
MHRTMTEPKVVKDEIDSLHLSSESWGCPIANAVVKRGANISIVQQRKYTIRDQPEVFERRRSSASHQRF